jgi:predicted ABC-type ATPase
MNPDLEEEKIKERALSFAKSIKKEISLQYSDVNTYSSDDVPTSIFMAGSPGAGKTETSQNIKKKIEVEGEKKVLCIDIDELRKLFVDYSGKNAHLFQHSATLLADAIHDKALKNSLNFIFDGTFSQYEIAEKNIKRSLDRGRFVNIIYVYQEPVLAWEFTKKRELIEGRRVTKEKFIDQFIKSREVVENIKKRYGSKIRLDIVIKNIGKSDSKYFLNQKDIKSVIKEKYSRQDLLNIVQ